LLQARLVVQHDGVYYVEDMPRFTQRLFDGPTWKELGLSQLSGHFEVRLSDPTKSNSGNVFAAILATMELGGNVPDELSVEQTLPAVKQYFERLGYMEPSTEELFKHCVGTGPGKCPIFAAYESQLIEYTLQNPDKREDIEKHLRFIYPQPTELGRHTLIALTANGEQLQRAMLDKDIQHLAATNHGFRTGTARPAPIQGLVESIDSVIQMPTTRVMDRITKYLEAAAH
jgi:hypothetical protein